MAVMIGGILFLCQPWNAFLHSWSVLVMLIGLISFLISVHIPEPEEVYEEEDDETGPVSISSTVRREGTDV